MRRRINFADSFKYAGAGIHYALRTQRNFRIHLLAAVGVIGVGLWLQLPLQSWTLLLLTIGLVLVTELFNTAVEVLVDLVTPDYHPLAKYAKDVAAGAVLVMALTSVGMGLAILGPPLLARLGLL
ncbi:MAG: diacylglycerol kinase family protein [Anaerolineae bacterium]|nr:diacylglycerol kinase family protein [Anaerolineae bacterium]